MADLPPCSQWNDPSVAGGHTEHARLVTMEKAIAACSKKIMGAIQTHSSFSSDILPLCRKFFIVHTFFSLLFQVQVLRGKEHTNLPSRRARARNR